jgi:DNA replication protein DnaC
MKGDGVGRAALSQSLRALHLRTIESCYEELALRAEREGWSYGHYLLELAQTEVEERHRRRIERLLKGSCLPREKTLSALEHNRLPTKVKRQLASLCEGGFVERAENVLAFGNPGVGKSHVLCAVAHELVKQGHSVLFIPAYLLVQRLLVAKRALRLEQELRKLDGYDTVLVDDIGYVQQDREEMEVLFTFLAERYERKSVMITSNLVFSQWEKIFKDPMTTAAAIDRLVHHAIILEMTCTSYRSEAAQQRSRENPESGGGSKAMTSAASAVV